VVLRIQDGEFELRYEFQRNGTFRELEFKDGQPVRMVEGVPPQTALDHFAAAVNHKVDFKLEELSKR
jgi:hypothetical protein